ncbi:MAG: pyridoxal 5'-phosphate synthase lyase subunit PdxS [Planctomycetota bacterium]|jgi:pyridoxal 5'-phosphate synthase pdxS subunit
MPRTPTRTNDYAVKVGLAEMLKGGVIMDVVNAEQARIAEDAGAVAVMALERVPADIRRDGGVARMAAVRVIEEVMEAVSIPVMAKCRIGHFVEAELLQELGVDFVDESEVLTPADEQCHVWKHEYPVPFVCGLTSLAEAARRIFEGAAMLRTKGEAGTGNVVEAVRHMRRLNAEMRRLVGMRKEEILATAKLEGAPADIYLKVAELGGKLPVPNFAAGGVATPADAALLMRLGAETVFVGSGVFKSEDPKERAEAIVHAVAHYQDAKEVLAAARMVRGSAMSGLDIQQLQPQELLASRGW